MIFAKPPPANPDDELYIAEFRGDVYIGFTDAADPGGTQTNDHNLFVRDDIYVGDKIFFGEGPEDEIPTQDFFFERSTGDLDTIKWTQFGAAPGDGGSIRASKDIVAERNLFLNAKDGTDFFLYIEAGTGDLYCSLNGAVTKLADGNPP